MKTLDFSVGPGPSSNKGTCMVFSNISSFGIIFN